MKIDWNRKYTTIAVYSFIVISLSIIFAGFVKEINKVMEVFGMLSSTLQPFVIGFVIAYLLNFILVFLEKKLITDDKVKSKKTKRAISLVLTYLIGGFTVYLFMLFVFPQLIESIMGLANDIPKFIENATIMITEISDSINIEGQYLDLALNQWKQFIDMAANLISNLLPMIGSFLTTIASSVWNIVIGLIISIYMLIEKEKFIGLGKKIIYALLNKNSADVLVNLGKRSNKTFGDFLSGKIIDSAIIGVLTFVILTVFKMPYTLLVSVIIGITNIIPFFGPFIGAVPAFVIIMFVSPIKALIFLVLIFIIQQIDGNIIGPKILGDSIGISAFWILFSILVAGKILGLVGMIIGVPLFAITYSVIKDIVESKLKERGLPIDTKDYM